MVLLEVVLHKPDIMGNFVHHSSKAANAALNNLEIESRKKVNE